MEKLNILKISVIVGLLSMGSSAWANQQDFYAKCTTNSTYDFGGYVFYVPSPVQVEPQFVDGMSPYGEVITVGANVRHSSWISVLAQFDFEGAHIEIEFSDVRSPSIGHGEIAGEPVVFACELLSRNALAASTQSISRCSEPIHDICCYNPDLEVCKSE